MTEFISGKAVISIGERGNDPKAERLLAKIVELCLRCMKREADKISSGKK